MITNLAYLMKNTNEIVKFIKNKIIFLYNTLPIYLTLSGFHVGWYLS